MNVTSGSRLERFVAVARKLAHGYLQGVGALTGASLVLGGLRHGRLGGLLVAAGGLALVSRSVTGRWVPRPGAPAASSATGSDEAPHVPTWDEVDEAGMEVVPG